MPDMTDKLGRFTAKMLAEASAEAQQAVDQAQQERAAALHKAGEQARLETQRYLSRELARVKAEAGRGVSRRMMEDQRALYLRREEMARETFDQVREKVEAFTRTPANRRPQEHLLAEALEQLPGAEDVEVELRPEDGTWQSRLAAAAGERKLTFRTGSFRMGGLVARSAGLGLRVDSSFDSAARDLSGHFAELFGLSLSDE